MEQEPSTEQQVLHVNAAYYKAFEACDMGAMAAVWEHSDRAICTHPGWATIRGWQDIAPSYEAIFANPSKLQFILTNEHVAIVGDAAWLTLDENLLQSGGSGTVATVNWFVRSGGQWLMAGHHGSSIMRSV